MPHFGMVAQEMEIKVALMCGEDEALAEVTAALIDAFPQISDARGEEIRGFIRQSRKVDFISAGGVSINEVDADGKNTGRSLSLRDLSAAEWFKVGGLEEPWPGRGLSAGSLAWKRAGIS